MASKVTHIISEDRVGVSLDGKYRQFDRNSEPGQKLEAALRSGAEVEEIRLLVATEAYTIAKNFQLTGRNFVLDDKDQLRLDGRVVDFGLTAIIKRMAEAGEDIEPLVNFIERAAKNPNKSVANDLYRFLSKGVLPISPDGCFHAYKRVGEDFRSIHFGHEPTWTQMEGEEAVETIGRTHYPVGAVVYMRREDCDEDRSQICSRGLHACSFDYLQEFNGQHIINVRIDPQDVTAIPNHYKDAKLRCCRMTVLAEIPADDAREYFSHAVDRRHPAVARPDAPSEPAAVPQEPEGPADWAAKGHEDGAAAGRSDKQNEFQYDPQIDFPYELDADDHAETPEQHAEISAHRQAFARGFHEGYAQGWNEAEVDAGAEAEDESVESDAELSAEAAQRLGTEDGEAEAQFDHDGDHGYINDFTDGDRYYEVADGDHEGAYRMAFNAAYIAKWQTLNA